MRTDFREWCRYVLKPIGAKPQAHHELLIRELQDIADGKNDRLIFNLPPGSAKSTYGSVLFPPWFLNRKPNLSIIGISNTADNAQGFSRRVQDYVRQYPMELRYAMRKESVEKWDTTNGGLYVAAGMGGTITGKRADLAIIDDPTKGREQVENEDIREKQWNWFTSDLRTRLRPEAAIVVIMTRWHQDDLGGRLLERQPGRWRVVSVPAQAEAEDDPLGREIGEYMWDDDPTYGYGAELRNIHKEFEEQGAMRDWAALFQQRPRPLEGSIFKVGRISTLPAVPAGNNVVRAWDLAATEQTGTRNPDWTCGVKMLRTSENRYVVLDVIRFRGGPDEVSSLILNTAAADGRNVRVGLPIDPGQASKHQILFLTRQLSGFRVESSPESGSKETRAFPFASQVNIGNVSLVQTDPEHLPAWHAAYRNELADFPSGEKDDQVDASSRAFAMVGFERPPPIRISRELLEMAAQRR